MSIKTIAFSFLTLAAGAVAAQAQTTVLDNVTISPITGSSDGTMVAESFVTGSSITTLADVMFPQLQQGSMASTYLYNYAAGETFSLYSNNPATGLPLLSLVNLTLTFGPGSNTAAGPINASTFGETVATVPSDAVSQAAATLAPGTKYWLELNSTSTISWDYANSAAFNSYNSGFTLPATGTASEVTKANGSNATYVLTSGPQLLYLSVVPEPSTYCLMAVAGLALVVSRKRTRKLA